MDQNFVTLSEAARLSPGKPHTASVWRWCRRGIKSRCGNRIKLEHIRAGGKIFIPAGALERFFAEVAEADSAHFDEPTPTPQPKTPTDRQRQRSIENANCVLRAGGIL